MSVHCVWDEQAHHMVDPLPGQSVLVWERLPPGEQFLRFAAPGHEPVHRTVEIVEGQITVLHVDLEPL